MKGNNKPPRWAVAFFRWFCRPDFREEIEGDLLERFHKRENQNGPGRNKLLFIYDVIALFRPLLIGNFHKLTVNLFSVTKRVLSGYAEYYLIILVFLCGYNPPFSVSSVSIGIIILLILQAVFKNKATGAFIAGLFILINLFLSLALMSEFNEFKTFDSRAQELLFVGSSIIVFNLTIGGAMIMKYAQGGQKGTV